MVLELDGFYWLDDASKGLDYKKSIDNVRQHTTMNILHVITTLRTGGAEHLMVDLLPRLLELGNNVDLLLFDGTRTAFYEQLEQKGIKIHYLRIGGNVYNPCNIFKLFKFMRKYDIVHTHNTACQLFVPIAKYICHSKAKLVTTEHNTSNRRRGKWYYKIVDCWMYSKYKKIICISDSTALNLVEHIGLNNNITVINNGICVSNYLRPIKYCREDINTIVMVAAFRPQKDHETLLLALKELPSNYHLQLVGEGERLLSIKSYADKLELEQRVDFLGLRDDIPFIYEKADVAVLSSHWEGFGLSAAEAMASGTPLIASDVDGLREVVKDAGILFPHGDYKQLAKEIRQLCNNPVHYNVVARECQERAKQFDISVMAQKYNELYQSL